VGIQLFCTSPLAKIYGEVAGLLGKVQNIENVITSLERRGGEM